MKKWLMLLGCVMLASCDYTVPLVPEPQLAIEPQLLGLWERTRDDQQVEQLIVLPLDEQEYLVVYPEGTSDVTMYARAWRVAINGEYLMQLKWIGNGKGVRPDDGRVYQIAGYSISGDELTVRLLNTNVIDKDIATTAELMAALEQNLDQANLFEAPMIFKRVVEE